MILIFKGNVIYFDEELFKVSEKQNNKLNIYYSMGNISYIYKSEFLNGDFIQIYQLFQTE